MAMRVYWQVVCKEELQTLGEWDGGWEDELEYTQKIVYMLLTSWAGKEIICTNDDVTNFDEYEKISAPSFVACTREDKYILRNLTKKKYIATGLPQDDEHSLFNAFGFGHILLPLIDKRSGFKKGAWVGDSFDIIPEESFSDDETWEDVGGEALDQALDKYHLRGICDASIPDFIVFCHHWHKTGVSLERRDTCDQCKMPHEIILEDGYALTTELAATLSSRPILREAERMRDVITDCSPATLLEAYFAQRSGWVTSFPCSSCKTLAGPWAECVLNEEIEGCASCHCLPRRCSDYKMIINTRMPKGVIPMLRVATWMARNVNHNEFRDIINRPEEMKAFIEGIKTYGEDYVRAVLVAVETARGGALEGYALDAPPPYSFDH